VTLTPSTRDTCEQYFDHMQASSQPPRTLPLDFPGELA
jgi:hypothetical protein